MNEVGKPLYFNIDKFVEVVEMFVASDEIIIALDMLNKLPGYYRDFEPLEITQLRKKIYGSIATIADYQTYPNEHYEKSLEWEAQWYGKDHLKDLGDFFNLPFCSPRNTVILNAVKEYNASDFIPHIVELGPSNYWVAHGLKKKGMKFTYEALTLNQSAKLDHRPRIDSWKEWTPTDSSLGPVMFICLEVVEHMWNHDDVLHYYNRKGIDAHRVVLSTPKYTMLGGNDPKVERHIEHLRTYTPGDFLQFASRLFRNYNWVHYDAGMQVLEGVKP